MNRDCAEGLRLRKRFEDELRQWGWFDACQKALEAIPVGIDKVHEFQNQVKHAQSALFQARYTYADHMAHCLVCSRRLVASDAIETINDKLKAACEEANRV